MAVYYKFKSAKDYYSISLDGNFISVAVLKQKIFECKHFGRGNDFDLVVTNAQTNQEYLDEEMLIPKNTSVLIRRVPGLPRAPIVAAPVPILDESMMESKCDVQPENNSIPGVDSSVSKYPEDTDFHEFGDDLYAIPDVHQVQSSNTFQDAPPPSKAEEDDKLKAFIDTTALDWQRQISDGFGPGRGFGRGMGGRMMGGHGFGRGGGGGLDWKTPPLGYICHRCKVPGHLIQHCPTNGDPTFDVKRAKPPTGIPTSMLMATSNGSYALPSGAVAVFRPNEAAFEKEMEGIPSSRSVGELPPELHCPLCKEVMKDAVFTSKCCFSSFCDKCIRDYIISKSICVCGAANVLADDLLPNNTVRNTISRILESNSSSGVNGGSISRVQNMESARCQQPKSSSPIDSAALPTKIQETQEEKKVENVSQQTLLKEPNAPQQTLEIEVSAPLLSLDMSEAKQESTSMKEPAKQGSALLADEAKPESTSMKEPALQGSDPLADEGQKLVSVDEGKKKKKKKVRLPPNAAEMQWTTSQGFGAENYMMPPLGPTPYNPYWNGMQQPGMDGFGGPYFSAMPYMGYGLGPMYSSGGVFPQGLVGTQGYMVPPFVPQHRDLADFTMGFNVRPPIMSKVEFEARKVFKKKQEMEKHGGSREVLRDGEKSRREVSSSGNVSSSKSKSVRPFVGQISRCTLLYVYYNFELLHRFRRENFLRMLSFHFFQEIIS